MGLCWSPNSPPNSVKLIQSIIYIESVHWTFNFRQMYIWIHDKYSSTSFKQRLWQRKIVLIWQNYFFKSCVSLWCSGQEIVLNVQINRVRLLATLFSVSLYSFFFCLVSFFLTLFFLLYSYCWPCWSCTWININFKLKSGVFCKRDFKSSSSAYIMTKLTTRKKTISCQDMSLLWNSWIVFNISWHHGKQHTVHHKLY